MEQGFDCDAYYGDYGYGFQSSIQARYDHCDRHNCTFEKVKGCGMCRYNRSIRIQSNLQGIVSFGIFCVCATFAVTFAYGIWKASH
jgi:hypothetical protein